MNLNERFLTPISFEERNKYKDEVYHLLYNAYKPIGGLFGIKDANDLVKQTHLWKLVRKNGKIIAAIVYQDKLGTGERKAIGAGSDQSEEGKKALFKIMQEDMQISDRHAIAEASGKMEHLFKKMGGIPIPNTEAQKILGPSKKILELNSDGIHYKRAIGPDEIIVEKVLFGFPVNKK